MNLAQLLPTIRLYNGAYLPDYVRAHSEVIRTTPWAMIVCLDSSYDMTAFPSDEPIFQFRRQEVLMVEGAVAFSGVHLLELLDRFEVFFGFDEVWFFSERPVHAVPGELSLQGPFVPELFDLQAAGSWMRENQALAGVGDGKTENPNLTSVAFDMLRWQRPAPWNRDGFT